MHSSAQLRESPSFAAGFRLGGRPEERGWHLFHAEAGVR
jgi:hypothetical protein